MIFGKRFTFQTDHKPLLTIFSHKNCIPVHIANRLQRWALLLAYDFQIQYIKTTEFGHADISRLINQQYKSEEEETVIASIQLEEKILTTFQDSLQFILITFKHTRSNQGGPYYATGNTIYTIQLAYILGRATT